MTIQRRSVAVTAIAGSAMFIGAACTREAEDLDGERTENPQAGQTTPSAEGQRSSADISADIIAIPEWHYDELYAGGVSVEDLLDAEVMGPTGEEIGDVENVLFKADGEVLSVIAEVGGILDIGDTHVNVPWREVIIGAEGDTITIPVTQETVEDHSLFNEAVLGANEASSDLETVRGDGAGAIQTAPRVWRARELIGDYARLKEGAGFVNYGYVDDLIIQDNKLAAVVVSPDVTWPVHGLYAYPYYGYGYGWYPALSYYNLPYAQHDIRTMEQFDSTRLDGAKVAEGDSGEAEERTKVAEGPTR